MLNAVMFVMKVLYSTVTGSTDAGSISDILLVSDESSSHRKLQDSAPVVVERESDTNIDASTDNLNPVIFWCITAIWMTITAALIIWLWKFNGAARLTAWTHAMVSSQDSDLAYRSRMATRRNNQVEAKRISPEERRAILEMYYRSNHVQMIVAESDLINGDSNFLAADQGNVDIEAGSTGMNSLKNENPSFCFTTTDEGSGSDAVVVTENLNSGRDGLIHDEESSSDGSVFQKDALVTETGVKTFVRLDSSVRSIDQGYLQLKSSPLPRRVPNCCAVCLGAYEVGESVVWSTACQHAFHEECVTDWLTKINEGNPCPCCRSLFANVDMDVAKKKKPISWEPSHSMNVNVISL